ncbi:HBR027Wp [Eremothecium sinecaudum]|uniref:HBR027Wp n=1 Tax=Eremothecium sinecaudum TaxID=45286 RepID=A0A109UWN8_9SACH|nr:HBR027Wp [Eremothecium sinecaudum]AMD18928.1 HBR027Wp [Eremothecium sinecaudum]
MGRRKGVKTKQRSKMKEFAKLKEKQRSLQSAGSRHEVSMTATPSRNSDKQSENEYTPILSCSPKEVINNTPTASKPIEDFSSPQCAGSAKSTATIDSGGTYISIVKSCSAFDNYSALEEQRLTRMATKPNVFAVMYGVFVFATDSTLLISSINHMASNLEAPTYVSLIAIISLLPCVIFQPFYNKIIENHTRRVMMLFATTLYWIGCSLAGFAPTVFILLLGRFLAGVGIGGLLTIEVQHTALATTVSTIGAIYATLLLTCFKSSWNFAFLTNASLLLIITVLLSINSRQQNMKVRHTPETAPLTHVTANVLLCMTIAPTILYTSVYLSSILHYTPYDISLRILPCFISVVIAIYLRNQGISGKATATLCAAAGTVGQIQLLYISPNIAHWRVFTLYMLPAFSTVLLLPPCGIVSRALGSIIGLILSGAIYTFTLSKSTYPDGTVSQQLQYSSDILSQIIKSIQRSFVWTQASQEIVNLTMYNYNTACQNVFIFTSICALVCFTVIPLFMMRTPAPR